MLMHLLMADDQPDISPKWSLIGVLASAVILVPFAGYIILAVWLAVFSHPLHRRVARALGGRTRLGAMVTVALLTLLLVPVAALVTSVVIDSIALVQQLAASTRGKQVLEQLVSNGDSPTSVRDLILGQADRAWA